jgi:predicted enzyme related to lactoylglutathione lyase
MSSVSYDVVHFEISGKDGRKLQEFYANLFDWKIDANNPMNYGLVPTGKAGIGGGITDGKPGVMIYIAVPDLQAALDKAVSLGGEVAHPIEHIPGMVTFAHFRDPEGNVMGLVLDDPNMK